jgi:hypothetical protein
VIQDKDGAPDIAVTSNQIAQMNFGRGKLEAVEQQTEQCEVLS